MSALSNPKVRRFLALPDKEDPTVLPYTPTLEERLNEAAADRGWAFGLISDALEALKDSAQTEAEVAEESLRRAERGLEAAHESARRILESGQANASRYEGQAAIAQANAVDDANAAQVLTRLIEDDEAAAGSTADALQ